MAAQPTTIENLRAQVAEAQAKENKARNEQERKEKIAQEAMYKAHVAARKTSQLSNHAAALSGHLHTMERLGAVKFTVEDNLMTFWRADGTEVKYTEER